MYRMILGLGCVCGFVFALVATLQSGSEANGKQPVAAAPVSVDAEGVTWSEVEAVFECPPNFVECDLEVPESELAASLNPGCVENCFFNCGTEDCQDSGCAGTPSCGGASCDDMGPESLPSACQPCCVGWSECWECCEENWSYDVNLQAICEHTGGPGAADLKK